MFYIIAVIPEKWLEMHHAVNGYQECHFDVKESKDCKVLINIGKKDCAF